MPEHKIRNRKIDGHTCILRQEEDLVTIFINSGVFVEARRTFRKFCMIDSTNPQAKAIFKSTAQIQAQEESHLRHHYYVIHPFSKARYCWEIIMLIIYSLIFLLIPIELIRNRSSAPVLYMRAFCDIFLWTDLCLFFCTGYLDVKKQKVILQPKKIIFKYIKSFFLFDLVSNLPISALMKIQTKAFTWKHWWIKLILIAKIVRIFTFRDYLKRLFQRLNIWSYGLNAVNSTITLLTLIWWTTAFIFILKKIAAHHSALFHTTESRVLRMTQCIYDVVSKFMLVGFNTGISSKEYDLIINIGILLFSGVLNMIMLAQIMQIYNRRSSSKNKFNNLMKQLVEYMNYKELSYDLKNRIFNFIHLKFRNHIYKEDEMMQTLSSHLENEISLQNCQKLVKKVEFFKDMPTELLIRIVAKMRTELYLPNDVIVQAGVIGHTMYFIYTGSVAVYTKLGTEICHLNEGSHFGEIALTINEPRVATVVAIQECEIFRLSRRDFQNAIQPYPELAKKIKTDAITRLESTKQMMKDTDNRSQT